MFESASRRVRLNRETVRLLGEEELADAAGGQLPGAQMQTAGTCPVSACICVTGVICQDLSAICVS